MATQDTRCKYLTGDGIAHAGAVTCYLHLKVIRQQFVLPVAEGERQTGKQQGIQDADNSQDVGPAHRAGPQVVLIRPLATHLLHLWRVPAVWVDHAAHHHQGGCGGGEDTRSEPSVVLLR